jgi:hypothetical protein
VERVSPSQSPRVTVSAQVHADSGSPVVSCECSMRLADSIAMSTQDAEGAVRHFISVVSKSVPAMISAAPATRRRAKRILPATNDGLPRCSTRIATQGWWRVNKPEVQAQNVLMRKWRVTGVDSSPDADAVVAYNKGFDRRCVPPRGGLFGHFSQCVRRRIRW